MPCIKGNRKVTCGNCEIQIRTKKYCTAQELLFSWNVVCTQCPNFSPNSQDHFNDYLAKKDSAPKPVVIFNCKLCCQDIPGLYALRQYRNTQQGFPIKTTNAEPDDVIIEVGIYRNL